MTLRIQETTIGTVCGNYQAKNLIGDVRGLGYIRYQAISRTLELRQFPLTHPIRRVLSLWPATQQISLLKTNSFAGARRWRRSRKNRPDGWLHCRIVLTVYSKRMIVCGLVWKRIWVKTHEGSTIMHPRSNRIKASNLSYRATVMQQRTTSYPPVALTS